MPVTVKAIRSFDHTKEYEVDGEDPSILGLTAPIGSRIYDRASGLLWTKTGALDTDWSDPSAGQKKLIFTRFDHNGVDGNYSYVGVGSNSSFECSFAFPPGLQSITSLDLIVIPSSTASNKSISLASSYGSVGQSKLQFGETNTLTGLSFIADSITAINIASVFTSVGPSGYIAGVKTDHISIGQTLKYLGLRLDYK